LRRRGRRRTVQWRITSTIHKVANGIASDRGVSSDRKRRPDHADQERQQHHCRPAILKDA
jgi:hypothetical protein